MKQKIQNNRHETKDSRQTKKNKDTKLSQQKNLTVIIF